MYEYKASAKWLLTIFLLLQTVGALERSQRQGSLMRRQTSAQQDLRHTVEQEHQSVYIGSLGMGMEAQAHGSTASLAHVLSSSAQTAAPAAAPATVAVTAAPATVAAAAAPATVAATAAPATVAATAAPATVPAATSPATAAPVVASAAPVTQQAAVASPAVPAAAPVVASPAVQSAAVVAPAASAATVAPTMEPTVGAAGVSTLGPGTTVVPMTVTAPAPNQTLALNVNATQTPLNEKESGLDGFLVQLLFAAVVLVILIIVAFLCLRKKPAAQDGPHQAGARIRRSISRRRSEVEGLDVVRSLSEPERQAGAPRRPSRVYERPSLAAPSGESEEGGSGRATMGRRSSYRERRSKTPPRSPAPEEPASPPNVGGGTGDTASGALSGDSSISRPSVNSSYRARREEALGRMDSRRVGGGDSGAGGDNDDAAMNF